MVTYYVGGNIWGKRIFANLNFLIIKVRWQNSLRKIEETSRWLFFLLWLLETISKIKARGSLWPIPANCFQNYSQWMLI